MRYTCVRRRFLLAGWPAAPAVLSISAPGAVLECWPSTDGEPVRSIVAYVSTSALDLIDIDCIDHWKVLVRW